MKDSKKAAIERYEFLFDLVQKASATEAQIVEFEDLITELNLWDDKSRDLDGEMGR